MENISQLQNGCYVNEQNTIQVKRIIFTIMLFFGKYKVEGHFKTNFKRTIETSVN